MKSKKIIIGSRGSKLALIYAEKAKENKKKHCVNTHIKEENDTESCHYNDKTKRCNTRKHK